MLDKETEAALEGIRRRLDSIPVLESQRDYLVSIIRSLPSLLTYEGHVYTTLEAWIREGVDFVKKHGPYIQEKFTLLGVEPTFVSHRNLWIFYHKWDEDQLQPDQYSVAFSRGIIPLEISEYMKADRIDTSKPYHDALPLSGWNSRENAIEALAQACLKWATRKAFPEWTSLEEKKDAPASV